MVLFSSDRLGPKLWEISQDIGERHVAVTMAWSNVWGNLGGSAVAKVISLILGTRLHYADWNETFWLCADGFALLAVAMLFVDSTLIRERAISGGVPCHESSTAAQRTKADF